MTSSKFCVFCGCHPQGKTKEHIIPKWLIELTGDPGRKAYFGFSKNFDADPKHRKYAFDQFTFLRDESISIDGVHFFGGTMWTNFNGGNAEAMRTAQMQMNDFRLIRKADHSPLLPSDTISLHDHYVQKLLAWFDEDLAGPRVVVSHHAPVINPRTQYMGSPLMPAFNSLDMQAIIEKHQLDLWIYGHTHECDDQAIGKTRIVSNQLGYPNRRGGFECAGFDERGKEIEIKK